MFPFKYLNHRLKKMWNQKQRLKVNHARKNVLLLSLQLEGVVSLGPSSEKFNIVSNDHGRTQKCDFCVGKTNFTDRHTPDTINGFRNSVLVCKMHDCYCTIHKNFEHFHSFTSALLINWWKRQTIAVDK